MSRNHNCPNCRFKARYDDDPRSLLGRLWRWHINWCPGWRGYLQSLPEGEREVLVKRYQLARRQRRG